MPKLLAIERMTAGYGDSIILEDVSLDLDEAGSLALLGRNGVGKTTLLLTLMGMTRVKTGTIAWRGVEVTALPTFRRAHAGIGWVPQERFMFPSLTVDEHLSVVARPGPWTIDRVYRMFPALMTNPRLLLLDEPMEGLAPIIVQELMRLIGELVRAGEFAVVVVEQHARLALQLTQQAIVLDRGRIVHRSSSDALLKDPESLDRLVAVA